VEVEIEVDDVDVELDVLDDDVAGGASVEVVTIDVA
jgi:hypothetical protein